MKYIKLFSILLTVFVVCSAFGKKGEQKGVYVAGVSASFTDSLIYFTDIQLMDSIALDKEGFLPDRQQYSYQLKNYLESRNSKSKRTCFIYFDTNKAKLEKTLKKMKEMYQKSGKSILRQVEPEFKFTEPETY
jgi:hypothetical protein